MWPTPVQSDYKRRGPNSKQQGLPEAVRLWPTPTANDGTNSCLPPSQIVRESLVAHVMRDQQKAMFPTVTTGAGMCGETGNYQQLKALESAGKISSEERRSMAAGNGGQLNPTWVEWLMGFPLGWTDLDA